MSHMAAEQNYETVQRYCLECGEAVEPGADFCYRCGSRRVFSVDSEDRVVLKKGECPYCSHLNDETARFCTRCGKPLGEYRMAPRTARPLKAWDYVVMALTFLPGAFYIFGLGHLALRKYSRGIMYLVISAVMIYIRYFSSELTGPTYIFLEVIGILIYLKQAMEVLGELFRWGD